MTWVWWKEWEIVFNGSTLLDGPFPLPRLRQGRAIPLTQRFIHLDKYLLVIIVLPKLIIRKQSLISGSAGQLRSKSSSSSKIVVKTRAYLRTQTINILTSRLDQLEQCLPDPSKWDWLGTWPSVALIRQDLNVWPNLDHVQNIMPICVAYIRPACRQVESSGNVELTLVNLAMRLEHKPTPTP